MAVAVPSVGTGSVRLKVLGGLVCLLPLVPVAQNTSHCLSVFSPVSVAEAGFILLVEGSAAFHFPAGALTASEEAP